jgi:hypothetical protein
MEKKKESSNLIITELFLVKADWTRTYLGEIRREVDSDGNPLLMGKVTVDEGQIWSMANCDDEILRKNMDDICKMKLDKNLHSSSGKTLPIAGTLYFLN